ncbi:MAG TPA: hypothetical protein VFI86_10925, partial [Burkholderiales bacterium]|nr:hypothetical protein [Burkholderiales bacterium]
MADAGFEVAAGPLGALGRGVDGCDHLVHATAQALGARLEARRRSGEEFGDLLGLTPQRGADGALLLLHLARWVHGGVEPVGEDRRRLGKLERTAAETRHHPNEGQGHGHAENDARDLVGEERRQDLPADLGVKINAA